MEFQLLDAFRGLFEGKEYHHRKSNLGDLVVSYLYEDLYALGRARKFVANTDSKQSVLNTANKTVGRSARRGDGTFGEAVPGVEAVIVPGFVVARGKVALIEIGAESKILAKAMMKQIGRVISDLRDQVEHFRTSNRDAISVAVVGINHADRYTSFEGERNWPTDGKKYPHPIQESSAVEQRLLAGIQGAFDEVIVLRFIATNQRPFPFHWVNEAETRATYAAALARISREYEARN